MITVLLTIVLFLVLITLHEFGHFIAAKLSGVGVLEFSVGMGPAIFSHQGKKTLYSIRLLPIGGYCSLLGENKSTSDPESFENKSPVKRLFVISAGAVLNLIFGFFVFMLVVAMGKTVATNEIVSVEPYAYISEFDISEGDKIIRINDKKIHSNRDISLVLSEIEKPLEDIKITLLTDSGKREVLTKLSYVERSYFYEDEGCYIKTSLNGEESEKYIAYTPEQAEELLEFSGTQEDEKGYILGVNLKREPVSFKNIFTESYHYTVFVTKMIYKSLIELFTWKADFSEISGPVGVAGAVSTAVSQEGFEVFNYLTLLGMITVNLGIFNLLPIPALDGGRLLFVLIELVTKKRVPPEKEGIVHTVGLVLLMVLAVVIFIKDIIALF